MIDGQSYHFALVNADCESSIRLEVMVTIDDADTPTTVNANQEFCKEDNHLVTYIDVKQDGLLYISQMAKEKRVEDPHDVVAVGDIINVEIINIDLERGRTGLALV